MDSWKKSCNYKQEKDAKGNITSYIIMVDKVPVKVTKEIYQMYSQSERRSRYLQNELEAGKTVSLDKLMEQGDLSEMIGLPTVLSAESELLKVIEEKEVDWKTKKLYLALLSLEESDLLLILTRYFLDRSTRKCAKLSHVSQTAILKREKNILKKLRKFF